MPLTVKEVTMALPDVVCVEVRDGAITKGQIFSNGGTPIPLASPEAFPITNVTASPVDGSIRITSPGAFSQDQYFGFLSNGQIGISGVVGVPNCNGSWNSTRITVDVIDLCATRFTGTWTPGTGKAWWYHRWTTYAPAGRRGWVFGPNQDYFRSCDVEPDAWLNRTAAKIPANWTSFGGRNVTAVYLKSKNYDHGYTDGIVLGQFAQTSSLKHYIFLKLDGPLAQGGPYAIVNTAAGISTNLTWNDRSTRALGICVNQVGHKTNDVNKTAYLALWMPGAPNEGAINFGAFTQFEVINNAGTTVAGPFPITPRMLSGEPETRISLTIDNIASGYTSTDGASAYSSTEPAKMHDILAISQTNPAVFTTVNPHGFAVGKRLRIHDIGNGGSYSTIGRWHNHTVKVVSVPAPDQVTLLDFEGPMIDGAGFDPPTYAQWVAGGSGRGYLAELQENSRAATNTYEMPFGSYNSASNGNYRLRIAGLGVSDPFPIRTDAWGNVAKSMAGGEYNHRHGMAHDGRFGQTRGANYIDGVVNAGNYGKIYQSRLPYGFGWGNLIGLAGNYRAQEQTCARPEMFFPTGTPFTWHQSNYGLGGGSWGDAGDWCTRIQGISGAVYSFAELARLRPVHAANTNYGLPKLLEMFPSVPEYAGTNGLPELFTQAVFGYEAYRRCQHGPGSYLPEGAVPGGLMMDTGTGTTSTPSSLTQSVNFANAPDHQCNFDYAFGAAKIAQGFYLYGFTAAGDMWRDSAIKAWNWAESLYLDPVARESYYNGVLGLEALMASGKFSQTPWTHAEWVVAMESFNNIYNAGWPRTRAASTLYKLTGGAYYKSIIELGLGYDGGNPNFTWFDTNGALQLAAWEYYNTPGAHPTVRSIVGDTFLGCWPRSVAGLEIFGATPAPKQPYRTMFAADNGVIFYGIHGIDLSAVHWAFIASHIISGDSRYLQVLQDGLGFIFGANQSGMSSVSQTGTRWHGTIFNADDLFSGNPCAPGIGCYMFNGVGQWFDNFGSWTGAGNAGAVESPDFFYTADHIFEREVVPPRYATPVYEAAWETTFHLSITERSVQQTVLPLQNVSFYLDAWDEVPKTTATVTISSNNNPSDLGESVTFTATVTGAGGPPTGTVTFRDDGAPIGSGTLAGGAASFTLTGLLVGVHNITAFYAGDVTFAPAGSAVLTQGVEGPPPPVGPNPYQFSVFEM